MAACRRWSWVRVKTDHCQPRGSRGWRRRRLADLHGAGPVRSSSLLPSCSSSNHKPPVHEANSTRTHTSRSLHTTLGEGCAFRAKKPSRMALPAVCATPNSGQPSTGTWPYAAANIAETRQPGDSPSTLAEGVLNPRHWYSRSWFFHPVSSRSLRKSPPEAALWHTAG